MRHREPVPLWRAYAWQVGSFATIVFFVILYDEWLAFTSSLLLVACLVAIIAAPKELGLLSWAAGIPVFYSVFFIGLPLLGRAIGTESEVTDEQVGDALFVAVLGLLAYIAGTVLLR